MQHFSHKNSRIVLAVCVICMTMLLPCCGKGKGRDVFLYEPAGGSGTADKTTLTFFGFKADSINLKATEAALQSFMSEHKNISITYEGIKGTAYWDAFDKRNAAGVLDDVFMVHHDRVVTMSAQGKLADLSDLPGLENYSDNMRGQFVNPDGSVYFLPTSISTYNLYINYDLLEAHGQSVPGNWAEFKACCDYFVGKGIVPIVANNRNSLTTLIIGKGLFDVYQQPNVDEIIQKFNEDPGLFAQTLAPGVEQTAQMLEWGWFDPAEVLVTEQTSDDLELFAQGDRPFMLSGGWASTRVITKEPGFSYGVHPYPILEDGSVLAIQADTCISVNAKSEHLEETKEFVKYLIQPDVMWEFCDNQDSYTPLREEKRIPKEKTLIPSTEYLSNGRVVLRAEYRLKLPTEAALERCARTLLEGGSADEAQNVLARTLAE